MRVLVWLHRYLGVTVGLLMALWCLSGFVMMYMPYPRLSEAERLQGLEPLQLEGCCALESLRIPLDQPLNGWRVEMLTGEPVLRLQPARGAVPGAFYELRSGRFLTQVDPARAAAVVDDYARGHHMEGEPRLLGEILRDQWTVQGGGRAPLYHFALDDAAGTELYVASSSGEVVQDTTRRERFWNYLGSVPHWLYPTVLRANGPLWSQVVIWTSLLGCFLTAIGIYAGIQRYTLRGDDRLSPFKGLWYWHHIGGLVFGVLTLTWIASGLFSMNPWGFLDSYAGLEERRVIAGEFNWETSRSTLTRALTELPPDPLRVELRSAPLAGQLYTLAMDAMGESQRYDSAGAAARLDRPEIAAAVARLDVPMGALEILDAPDDYYYPHHDEAIVLPVWRVLLDDAQRTRLYLDPGSGRVLSAADSAQRQFRWLHLALHRFDFAALRSRPLWDVVVWLLLAGVSFACITGAWMSCRRIAKDWRALRARLSGVRTCPVRGAVSRQRD